MAKVMVVLDEKIEENLRNHIRKRGDLSKIINEALEEWLQRN